MCLYAILEREEREDLSVFTQKRLKDLLKELLQWFDKLKFKQADFKLISAHSLFPPINPQVGALEQQNNYRQNK